MTTHAWLPRDLYSGTRLAFKACSEGNRRRWHVAAEQTRIPYRLLPSAAGNLNMSQVSKEGKKQLNNKRFHTD